MIWPSRSIAARPALEGSALVRRDAEQLRESVLGNRHALLEQDVEDEFAAGQRMLVARLLALEERIVARTSVARAAGW